MSSVMCRRIIQVLALSSAAWAGCSSDRGSFDQTGGQLGDRDAGSPPDAGCSGLVCSRDLRSVRDCEGKVVEECAVDKACGNGACIDPCDAAALNEGSVGCSFAIPGQNSGSMYGGSCTAVFVANSWTSPANLRLEFDGKEVSLDGAVWVPEVQNGVVTHHPLNGPVPPGGGAVVFLSSEDKGASSWLGCPKEVKTVFEKEPTIPATGIGRVAFAFADVPVSMYSMYPYGGAPSHLPSAALLFPTTTFRKNYVAVTTWGGRGDVTLADPSAVRQVGQPTLQIVATEDDTSVALLPTVGVSGGNGVASGFAHEVIAYTLQRGDVMQLTQEQDLVGSVIEASKPVGVFGGGSCMFIPGDTMACDTDNVQIPPVSSWGSEYVVLPPPNRKTWRTQGAETEQDWGIVRIVGAVDGTELTYEPWVPQGAPATLKTGQQARFIASRPFVVRSQDADHPFYVAAIMTSAHKSSTHLGDPETALVIPPAQWLDSYVFFSDHSYELSAVAVTRQKENGRFHDVNLDCAGVLAGWQPINADYEWTFVELSRHGEGVRHPGGACTDGAHRMNSAGPFSMTVWGIASYSSYAYPGGALLRKITDVHVPAVVR